MTNTIIGNLLSLPGELKKLSAQLASIDEASELKAQLEKTEALLSLAQRQTGVPAGLTEAEKARWVLETLAKHAPGLAPVAAINRQLELIHVDRLNRWGNYGFELAPVGSSGHDAFSKTRILECKTTINGSHSVGGTLPSFWERVSGPLTEEQQEKCLFSSMHHRDGEVIRHVVGPLVDLKKLAKNGKHPKGCNQKRLLEIGFTEVVL